MAERKGRKKSQRTGQQASQRAQDQGPSPGHPTDERMTDTAKSEWQERTAPAADDALGDVEKKGFDLLGRSDVREGALPGVGGGAGDLPGAAAGGVRRNPPELPDAGLGDGGISMSGGVAGGERGHGGASVSGAGGPLGESRGGPGQYKASSRFDLDHPSSDVGEGEEGNDEGREP
jgi:hypothetical protein